MQDKISFIRKYPHPSGPHSLSVSLLDFLSLLSLCSFSIGFQFLRRRHVCSPESRGTLSTLMAMPMSPVLVGHCSGSSFNEKTFTFLGIQLLQRSLIVSHVFLEDSLILFCLFGSGVG